MLPEVLLPPRVQRRIAPVAQEQIELDLVVPLPVEQVLVVGPAIRADRLDVLHPVGVLPLRRFRVQESPQGIAPVLAGRFLPVRLDRLPKVVVDPLVVGVPVLHYNGGHSAWVLLGEPVTDRGAVILHVQGVARQPDLFGELLDHVSQVVEGVGEPVPRRHRALAEPGVVRRDDVVLLRQCRDQIAEHVRTGRKAVQQENRGRVASPSLPVKDVEAVYLDGSVAHDGSRAVLYEIAFGRHEHPPCFD